MKKILSLALAMVMVLGMVVPSLVPTVKAADVQTIYQADTAPVMDGVFSDGEYGEPYMVVEHNPEEGTAYTDSYFYFTWYEDNVYVAARVASSAETATEGKTPAIMSICSSAILVAPVLWLTAAL